MLKIHPLSYVNISIPRIGCLWFSCRCISTCFAGVGLPRAGVRLRTINNHQPSLISKHSRTLSMKTYKPKVIQRDKNFNCFFILSASKDIPRWTSSTREVQKFAFSSRDVGLLPGLLPDEFTEKITEKKKVLHKDTNKSIRKFGPHEYEFDANGYLSVDDVVKFLGHEAGFDICVIETSGAKRAYVDYFIVVSGVSNRHIRAMAKNLEQLFRGHSVRGISKQGHVTVEGLESNSNWLAVDIGNMAVHFFLPEVRQLYELEKLWTLGPKYDDQYKTMLEEEEFLQAVFLGEHAKNSNEES